MSDAEGTVETGSARPPRARARRHWLRRFAIEALIDAAILVVIVLVLGIIHIPQPFPFGTARAPIVGFDDVDAWEVAWFAGMVVLANRFARPVIVAVVGRLVLRTLGLFVVVINAVTIYLAALVSPDFIRIADPYWVWLLIAAALYTALSAVVMTALGLNRPSGLAVGGGPIWETLEALPTPRRNSLVENLRLQQVYQAIYATSLDVALADTPVGRVRRWSQAHLLGESAEAERLAAPERMRGLLQDLGPTYVKIGQMLASRRDLLPAEWTDELAKLQSEARPFSWDEARAVLVAELGREPEALFAAIEPEPFAAASTAQVHRALGFDGRLVAVKIQRPQILAKTKADLGVIQELASVAEARFALARQIGAADVVGEFASGVLRELDYRNEVYQARRLADGMAKFPAIHIPDVVDELSSARVLTMEFVEGIKISNADAITAAGLDTQALGSTFIRAIIKQVLVDGFFHGDPHPGNVLVDPKSGRIVFLDLGLVGRLDRQQRLDLLSLIYAVREVDIPGIADGLMALGTPGPGFDEARFRDDIDQLAHQYLIYGHVDSLGMALGSFLGAVFEAGLRLDSQLTLAIKAVIQAEETARALSWDIDIAGAAAEEAADALREALDYDRLRKQARSTALRLGKEVARRVPSVEEAAFKWFDMFNRGRITVEVDTADLGKRIGAVAAIGRQATVGLIVVGQLIGTAIVMAILLQPGASGFEGLAYAAMIAFAITLIVSFWVLFRMLTERDDDEPTGRRRR
jgi:ubiquinone biosynthesis protein